MKALRMVAPLPPLTPQLQHQAAGVWPALRRCGVIGMGILLVLLFVLPPLGLALFWGMFVGVLPVLLLLVPGVWRNICPMALLNGIAGRTRWARGGKLPPGLQACAPFISVTLFVAILPLRTVLLDRNGPALAMFLLLALMLAVAGGLLFAGKSGWCSQFCPMLQLERFYGQSPVRVVRDTHCRPCVGCTRHCYDLLTERAAHVDLLGRFKPLVGARLILSSAMPWLCYAFFTQPDLLNVTGPVLLALYSRIVAFACVGVAVSSAIEALTTFSQRQIQRGQVVATINLFYWFTAPTGLHYLGMDGDSQIVVLHVGMAALSVCWLWRTRATEPAARPRHVRNLAVTARPR